MNKEEFESEALRIAESLTHTEIYSDAWIVANANALRDLILKDLAENNPPVAWMCHSGEIWNTQTRHLLDACIHRNSLCWYCNCRTYQ